MTEIPGGFLEDTCVVEDEVVLIGGSGSRDVGEMGCARDETVTIGVVGVFVEMKSGNVLVCIDVVDCLVIALVAGSQGARVAAEAVDDGTVDGRHHGLVVALFDGRVYDVSEGVNGSKGITQY